MLRSSQGLSLSHTHTHRTALVSLDKPQERYAPILKLPFLEVWASHLQQPFTREEGCRFHWAKSHPHSLPVNFLSRSAHSEFQHMNFCKGKLDVLVHSLNCCEGRSANTTNIPTQVPCYTFTPDDALVSASAQRKERLNVWRVANSLEKDEALFAPSSGFLLECLPIVTTKLDSDV